MKSEPLHEKKCIPCSGEIPPLSLSEAKNLLDKINSDWELKSEKMQLWRSLKFDDYKTPWKILNLISEIAEKEWHHPELTLGFGKLDIGIWTHKIDGLVESDFIFAAKIDQIIKEQI